MLEINDLTKIYNGRAVVNGLTIHVNKGELYAFLGPNGAGKSTTIDMIIGLVTPSRGSVNIAGKSLRNDYFGIKTRLGVVGEFPYFYGDMTGLEFLAYFASLYGIKANNHYATELIELLDLGRYIGHQVRSYSKGMQQKLSLARALLHRPDLVILDEPVSSLDPAGTRQVRDLILAENARGTTFFISSHLLSEIERTCHRVAIINKGSLLAEDTMEGIKSRLQTGMEIEVELSNMPETVLALLTAQPWVEAAVCRGDRKLKIKTKGARDYRAEITRLLVDQGCELLGLSKHQLSLEEAFMAITESTLGQLAGKDVAS